jgi:hypothetical protein
MEGHRSGHALSLEDLGIVLKLRKKWKLFSFSFVWFVDMGSQIDLFDVGSQMEIMDFDILDWIFGQVLPCYGLTARSAVAGARERRGGYCHESRSRACEFARS